MKVEAIKKTAIHWIDESGDHIVESPLCPMVSGVADTEAEAWQIFNEMLEEHIGDLKANRVAKGPGRPAKGKAKFAVEIEPETKTAISACAKDFNISQGELIEYLFRFHEIANKQRVLV